MAAGACGTKYDHDCMVARCAEVQFDRLPFAWLLGAFSTTDRWAHGAGEDDMRGASEVVASVRRVGEAVLSKITQRLGHMRTCIDSSTANGNKK